jgi:hypothetical protein
MATSPPLLLRYLIGIGPTALSQTVSGTGDRAESSIAEGEFSWEGGRSAKPHPPRSDGSGTAKELRGELWQHRSAAMCVDGVGNTAVGRQSVRCDDNDITGSLEHGTCAQDVAEGGPCVCVWLERCLLASATSNCLATAGKLRTTRPDVV